MLSYQKMLGQLQDAGNSITLAGYLLLLPAAGPFTGARRSTLVRRSGGEGPSPKLLALNTALVSALSGLTIRALREQPERWGRLVETAVGAHLAGEIAATAATVSY